MSISSFTAKRRLLTIILFAAILAVFYFPSLFKWWFEDDPLQFYAASQIANPLDIFTNPEILHTFGTGRAVVPMQILSYWIDVKLFGFNPLAANVHSFCALILTAIFLFVTLKTWFRSEAVATATAAVWLLLPATLDMGI